METGKRRLPLARESIAMKPEKPATMAQIAERAGVALSTVSYALSGKRAISDEARAKVLQAVADLDYHPHGPARALASGASHTIALFLPSPHWDLVPIQQTFVAGATQATSASDYSLLLITSPTAPEDIVRLLAAGRADGVILMEILTDDPRVEALEASGHSFTLIGRTARHDRNQLRRHRLRRGGAKEPRASRRARASDRCALQLPAGPARRRLHLRADRARRVRRDHGRARHPRHPAPVPAHAERSVRGGNRAAAVGAGLHGGDHDRLAVHRAARRPPRRGPARPGRLLDRVGGRLAVRGDAHPGADLCRVARIRGRPGCGRDADRAPGRGDGARFTSTWSEASSSIRESTGPAPPVLVGAGARDADRDEEGT